MIHCIVGPDVEVFEEAVRDLVLGVEVAEPEHLEEQCQEVTPDTCSPPSTRMTSPLIQEASSSVSR